jgi:ferredoxin
MAHSVRVEVDEELCIGAANCELAAPGAFEVGADGIARVLDPEAVEADQLRQAETSCPSGAIRVIEA